MVRWRWHSEPQRRSATSLLGVFSSASAIRRLASPRHQTCAIHEFRYAADSWNVERRVVTRLEYGAQSNNPRFIVTNLDLPPPRFMTPCIARAAKLSIAQPTGRYGRDSSARQVAMAHALSAGNRLFKSCTTRGLTVVTVLVS